MSRDELVEEEMKLLQNVNDLAQNMQQIANQMQSFAVRKMQRIVEEKGAGKGSSVVSLGDEESDSEEESKIDKGKRDTALFLAAKARAMKRSTQVSEELASRESKRSAPAKDTPKRSVPVKDTSTGSFAGKDKGKDTSKGSGLAKEPKGSSVPAREPKASITAKEKPIITAKEKSKGPIIPAKEKEKSTGPIITAKLSKGPVMMTNDASKDSIMKEKDKKDASKDKSKATSKDTSKKGKSKGKEPVRELIWHAGCGQDDAGSPDTPPEAFEQEERRRFFEDRGINIPPPVPACHQGEWQLWARSSY